MRLYWILGETMPSLGAMTEQQVQQHEITMDSEIFSRIKSLGYKWGQYRDAWLVQRILF